jgi:hypothetical protein
MITVKGLKTGLVALVAVGALLAGPMTGGEAFAGKKSSIKARIADAIVAGGKLSVLLNAPAS